MTDILPIKLYKKQILYSIEQNDVVLITAETGSGKTTRKLFLIPTEIPQFLIQAGYTINNKKIAISLPRKIAAISLAKRVSEELGCFNGEIAHKVRFNSTVNENSRVIFMTDGSLVQQLYSDPLLSEYSVIILDDVHERSINNDILFSFIKRILLQRPTHNPLRVVITSANLENQTLKLFFQINKDYKKQQNKSIQVQTINITGRLHAVDIFYLKQPSKNYFLKIFQTIVYIDREKRDGDVLVFLVSVQEIEGMKQMVESYCLQNRRKLKILALHSKLPLQEQKLVFEHTYERKVILSTNISESSITIPNINYVIDSGYVKVKIFDSQSAVEKMIVVPCGKTSANQRAGRAGRVVDGQCFRIYHEQGYQIMPDKIPPEIMRVDLSNFILKLKGLGINDILAFQMLEKPTEDNLTKAIDILFGYDLIDDHFELTQKGKKVAQFTIDIRNSCMLLNSFDAKFGCSRQILMLVAMLQVLNQLFAGQGLGILKAKKKIGAKEGDFLSLINIFIRYQHGKQSDKKRLCGQYKVRYNAMEQAVKIHDELVNQIKKFNRFKSEEEMMEFKYGEGAPLKKIYEIKSSQDQYQSILRCILTGYFTNIAQLQGDGTYLNIRSQEKLQLHSTSILSVVYPEWIIYHQIIRSTAYYMHNASQIYTDWIFELAGHYYKDNRKDQAQQGYNKEQLKQIQPYSKKQVTEEKALLQVGGFKKKIEPFNTSVLGLKKVMKKTNLSFQQEI